MKARCPDLMECSFVIYLSTRVWKLIVVQSRHLPSFAGKGISQQGEVKSSVRPPRCWRGITQIGGPSSGDTEGDWRGQSPIAGKWRLELQSASSDVLHYGHRRHPFIHHSGISKSMLEEGKITSFPLPNSPTIALVLTSGTRSRYVGLWAARQSNPVPFKQCLFFWYFSIFI